MAMRWRVATVSMMEAIDGLPPGVEPFAVRGENVYVRILEELEGDRSSVYPENFNVAGNEPDVSAT